MSRVDIVTWNVLHRIHAENHLDSTLARHPDEPVRIASITRHVEAWVRSQRIVCLQEVSGDQLASLRAELEGLAALFVHRYPRLPRLRKVEDSDRTVLQEPSEQLVTLVPRNWGARLSQVHTFGDDPGKGFLGVTVDDLFEVLNTHVSYGNKRQPQLGKLREVMARPPRPDWPMVLGGDFNATREVVEELFLAKWPDESPDRTLSVSRLPAEGPRTHPGEPGEEGRDIDHLLLVAPSDRGRLLGARVDDGGELSDHRPVVAELEL